ncbi:hypothetical protein GQ53DRAFT_752969, partial [Thozetella sp. PMI_491]
MPTEILGAIFEYLCPHCTGEDDSSTQKIFVHYPDTATDERWRSTLQNFRAVRGVCYSCTRLQDAAMPFLFHRVRIDSWARNELFPLTQLFCQHPQLASLVKELEISFSPRTSRPAPFPPEDIEAFASELAGLGVALSHLDGRGMTYSGDGAMDTDSWRDAQELNIMVFTLLTDLLLFRTTSIEHLKLECIEFDYIGMIKVPYAPFRNLISLSLEPGPYNQYSSIELGDLSYLVQKAPNLSYITGARLTFLPTALPLTNLRFLHIPQGCLTGSELAIIFEACPKLESFRYNHFSYYGLRKDIPVILPTEVYTAMRPVKATLKHLDLDLEMTWQISDPGPVSKITDLTEFVALELLCLAVNCIYSEGRPRDGLLVKLLPESIVSLSIDYLPSTFSLEVKALGDAVRAGRFPNLRYFYYVPTTTGYVIPHDPFKDTAVKCRRGWLRGI